MKIWKTIHVLAVLLFFGEAFSQSKPIDSIQFFLKSDNRIYTYVKVNDVDSLLFLIDTGASDMVINSEIITKKKLKLNFDSEETNSGTTGINIVKKSSGNKAKWGLQEIDNLSFISIPYPNELWDGVLGLSLLKRFCIEINYDKKLVYLFDKVSFKNQKQNTIKFKYKERVPFVDIRIKTIDGKTRNVCLEIDTGSDRILDLSTSYVNLNKLLDVYKQCFAVSNITSSDGNTGKIFNVYFPQINIADFHFYKIPGGVAQIQNGIMNINGIDGIIGNSFLKRFNITLDFKNELISFEPNDYLHTKYFDFLAP
ncbi:pepsin/retropepsin-like aspartic protease family protein [Flavobacterium aurantiibacter]|uniref:Peptidase A2 domain-containing protein n=1 Tax=Flavobacterium aurantiibacter TaxID=2023067 RepID=A0A255ZUU9_9FLAO|nr:pepsin/retropepsin-like aspartic protease family protein [Flavobacterium aurantiibacter]OYQ45191.1 hypothetical protein CHX27_06585 [Flavobacterium aurantiibacter]